MPFTFFKSKPKTISEGYAQYTGSQIAAGGGPPGSEKFTESKKTTFGFSQAKDDFLMDIGAKDKTIDYYARLDDRKARSKAASKNLGKDIFGREASETKKTKSVKDKKAEERKLAIQKLRDEARERRRKFYQQKDIETLNIRQRLGLA